MAKTETKIKIDLDNLDISLYNNLVFPTMEVLAFFVQMSLRFVPEVT